MTDMVERHAAILKDYVRDGDIETARTVSRATLLAALDPEDASIVEALAREECKRCGVDPDFGYRGEGHKAWHDMTDCARDTLAVLRAAIAQGEP